MRAIRCLLLSLALGGCVTWTSSRPPRPARPPLDHGAARLHLRDGRVVELRSTDIRSDSITGIVDVNDGERVAYATADVLSIQTRRHDPVLTTLLIIVVTAAAIAATFVVLWIGIANSST